MEKPANQDVVTLLLDIIRDYLSSLRPAGDPDLDWELLIKTSNESEEPDLQAAINGLPDRERELRTLYLLSGVGYGIVRPIFSKTDAIGSLMRKKLQPVFEPLQESVRSLVGIES
jgi:DNA-directed RNA polymerase specialized sigma24 family protein